jgi:hypothetical protein
LKNNRYFQILVDTVWALSYLTDGGNDQVERKNIVILAKGLFSQWKLLSCHVVLRLAAKIIYRHMLSHGFEIHCINRPKILYIYRVGIRSTIECTYKNWMKRIILRFLKITIFIFRVTKDQMPPLVYHWKAIF